MTMVAIGLFGFQQYRDVSQAREHYDWVCRGWENDFNTREEVVAASESLRQTEANSLWISDRKAREQHVERLSDFVRSAEGAVLVTMYGSMESRDRALDFIAEVRALIHRQQTMLSRDFD